MKNLWLLIFLLATGCSDNSDNPKQSTNDVASANESANSQIKNLLCSRYSVISNWDKNLSRHGKGSIVFSIDVQKALNSTSPILFKAHLRDIFQSKEGFTKRVENIRVLAAGESMYFVYPTNETTTTYAEFKQAYKHSDELPSQTDFALELCFELNDEQVQKLLSAKDIISNEYAIVAKVSKVIGLESDDDYPTLSVYGTCVDFSLLK
jgi:hypothetical protein